MKIYTKTGDNGTTGLYDGSRVQKSEQILDALGALDELSAHIGRLLLLLKKFYITEATDKLKLIPFFISLQSRLLNIGSIIATPNPTSDLKLPEVTDVHVKEIENLIDAMDSKLKPLTSFIIQDGKNEIEVQSHICRTITRRAERDINKYGNVSDEALKFINRLSDLFFTLARYVSESKNLCY
jgi:cob(I)alamin adenosyltransferase